MTEKPVLKSSIRHILISLGCLWLGALFVWLGRFPNQLTALLFDRWAIILPFISVMSVAFWICRKRQWRVVNVSLIVVCVLFAIAVLNFSMWMTIRLENNTSVLLTAVMTNLSKDTVRVVSIQPGDTKLVELVATYGGTETYDWHLLIYDGTGKVYDQQVIKGAGIDRRHLIRMGPEGH